ncbi:hypothetical protein MIT9_P1461 [Methylomarinovum caldicuralii]|uniref:G domain-containing protein n=1 Tax=Methylomarinovum caldicuralii TaxID=438856 RepID=A0AAU9C3Z5_9GAMM|nr:GTPase [Methylomarinovum caldicuralii]BCX81879.1 hypothetical protein MIT9_P1461 [Methylomarinovum caldicuralii]
MDSVSFERLSQWFQHLAAAGFITPEEAERYLSAARDDGGPLFEVEHPPLIVAFFGGTGVGKSTLLNRLAGEAVARTGIERPTSREVTVYLHRSLPTEALEHQLPLAHLRLARHANPNRRDVVWIDMPDIDSVEESNRELVLQCLPHVDVLIYVVSPERYKDDTGWQMLQRFGHRHGWLFVMNHWDQGHEAQIEDFTRMLRQAGFKAPVVLRCDSREDLSRRRPDDFGKLEEILTRLARNGGAEHLQQRNRSQRMQELADRIERLVRKLDPESVAPLVKQWQRLWRQTCDALAPSLEWPTKALAREIAGKGQKRLKSGQGNSGETLLWDLWSQKHLQDALDRLVLEAGERGLPAASLKQRLEPVRKRLDRILIDQVQRTVRAALARPGHSLRRGLLWLTAALRYLLPLAAGGWVAWQVVARYYRGFTGEGEYLGLNFAVHSLLLIGLACLIPFLLHRLLEPSLEKVAESGIRAGIYRGFEQIEAEVVSQLQDLEAELEALRQQGQTQLALLRQASATPEAAGEDDLLARIYRR